MLTPEEVLEASACRRHLTISTAADAGGRARSHLGDGRSASWSPPAVGRASVAVDAELANRAVPAALAGRFGVGDPEEFWPLWTQLEVCCKLLDVPVVLWLGTRGLAPHPAVAMRTLQIGDLIVTCGLLHGTDGRHRRES